MGSSADNNNNSYPKWRASQSEFMGYVRAKLETIHDELVKHDEQIESLAVRMRTVEKDVSNIRAAAGAIGAVFGVIGSFFINVFSFLLRR